ncbi:hypothetical protein EKO04_011013 [Ascochyta lentis]|uniref:Peptidyl-prolyl cis-trans isomerase n=1 Tax=Ascochyta lentis TaxID=205686 RepID=A0A8H7MDG5_9PLEO|nr:hypothetical protein EKO04_011013 [Ascochyta lentis]
MAPKNKGKGKDAGDSKDAGGGGKGKLKPATSINVRHILCEKHSKKEEALEKIRNGAKFDEVAREMSEDKARQGTLAFDTVCSNEQQTAQPYEKVLTAIQGGSLGWKVRGSLMLDFEKVAYDLEPSTTGAPKIGEVKTSEGYHIIMVEGRK